MSLLDVAARAAACTLMLACAAAIAADPGTPKGPQLRVSGPNTQNDDIAESIAVAADGTLTAVWTRQDDFAISRIYLRRLGRDGQPLGDEFTAHAAATGYFAGPSIAGAPDGRFVVAWGGSESFGRSQVHVRRFDGNGNPVGDELIASTGSEFAGGTHVAMNPAGDFVVAWGTAANVYGEGPYGAWMRVYNADGTPRTDPLPIGAENGSLSHLQGVGIDASGRVMASWATDGHGSTYVARCYSSAGEAGDSVVVSTGEPLNLPYGAAAMGADGTVAIVVQSVRPVNGYWEQGAYLHLLDGQCTRRAAERRANDRADRYVVSPTVTVDAASGQLFVGWLSQHDGSDAVGRIFTLAGEPLTGDIAVSEATQTLMFSPAGGFDGAGDLWAAWSHDDYTFTSYGDIYARSFAGAPQTPNVSLHVRRGLRFGGVRVGRSRTAQVTVINDGGAAAHPGAVTLVGTHAADFAVAANGCTGTLAPGASCQVGITFAPTALDRREALLQIVSDAAGSPHRVLLAGIGTGGVAEVSPPSIDFGGQPVGSRSHTEIVEIRNAGNAVLRVQGKSLAGAHPADYRIHSDFCDAPVAPGDACIVVVDFQPRRTGERRARLHLATDALNRREEVPLIGNGTGACLDPARDDLCAGF